MSFTISDLREQPHFTDAVADRIWQAWWAHKGVSLGYIRGRLNENLNTDVIPFALVAHDGSTFLGTSSVIPSDLEDLPEFTPWVAAVWVDPEHRTRQIGRSLVARAGGRLCPQHSPHLSLRPTAAPEFLSAPGLAANPGECRGAGCNSVYPGAARSIPILTPPVSRGSVLAMSTPVRNSRRWWRTS